MRTEARPRDGPGSRSRSPARGDAGGAPGAGSPTPAQRREQSARTASERGVGPRRDGRSRERAADGVRRGRRCRGPGASAWSSRAGSFAAGLCEVGAATTAPADHRGHLLDELAGLEALGEVLGDGRHEVRPCRPPRSPRRPRPSPAGRAACRRPRGARRRSRPSTRPAMTAHAVHLTAEATRSSARERASTTLQLLRAASRAARCSSSSFRSRWGTSSGLILRRSAACRRAAPAGDGLERGGARDGLDPAHAGRDGALRGDLKKTELPRALEMRAAAELRGEVADLDDPHALAVLLAEEGEGAQPRAPRRDPSRPAPRHGLPGPAR